MYLLPFLLVISGGEQWEAVTAAFLKISYLLLKINHTRFRETNIYRSNGMKFTPKIHEN
jgi:hypothetical protein